MIKVDRGLKFTADEWGNNYAWLPFGKAGEVNTLTETYQVCHDDVMNPASIETLVGTPVYISHPESGVVTSGYYSQENQVGTCLDKWRDSEDGLGAEVLVRMCCPSAYKEIQTGSLCEVSPCYMNKGSVRVFNHLALLPKGYAFGGSKMSVCLEGSLMSDTTKQSDKSTPLEKGVGVNAKTLFTNIVENKVKEKTDKMEELLNQVIGGQTAILSKVSELVAMEKVEDATEDFIDMEGVKSASRMEGYTQGLLDGETVAHAVSNGFDTTTVAEGSDVATSAKLFVIQKSLPDLKVEGAEGAKLDGLYAAAKSLLAVAAVKKDVKSEGADVKKAPTIEHVEEKPKNIGRYPLSV